MKPARTLTPAERATLARKLGAMQAAVERRATTRRLAAVALRAAQEEITRVDLPAQPGRYFWRAS